MSGAPLARTAQPPATAVAPVRDTLHGVSITDDYRWLEGDNSDPENMGAVTPDVAAWTDAQNAHTRAVLDALPGRAALEDALRPLMQIGSVGAPDVRAGRYFYGKREGAENQATIYWREGIDAADRVLIDPAALDPTGLTAIEWTAPSHDGRLVAYGTYRAGDENTTLHVLEVDSGRVLPLEIRNRVSGVDWLPDASGFIYRHLANANEPYTGRIMFHRMGTPPEDDAVLFRQFTKDEDAALATTWGPTGGLSQDGRWLVLGYWIDTASNDLWIASVDDFLRTGVLERRVVSTGVPGQASGDVVGDTLFVVTTKGAPNGRIVSANVTAPDMAHWRDVVPERAEAVIAGVAFARGLIVVTYLEHASNVVEVFDLSGRSIGRLAQPGIGAAGISAEPDRTDAFLTFTSFNYPTTIFHVDLTHPSAEASVWQRPDVPVDPSTVEVEQVWYASKDGTRVSMFLAHRKDLAPTGDVPVILTGYGGFNISETPVFAPTLFQWFAAGGLLAMPNLRGGGEYGDAWHEAGMLERKQNVFDDFIAAAEWLIANRWTTPARLAISGGSNGGLLTGAVLTQRPDLFGAVVTAVPLLDMLRYQYFLMARYWVPEYGTAEDPSQFPYLLAYSPYHHVHAGARYPGVFLTAGEHDTRVHACHARKMAARLQAASAGEAAGRPVLLWVDREAGHGQGKPLNLRLRDTVDQRIFLMWQLGILR